MNPLSLRDHSTAGGRRSNPSEMSFPRRRESRWGGENGLDSLVKPENDIIKQLIYMSFKRWLFLAVFLFVIGLAWGLFASVDTPGLLTEDVAALEKLSDFLLPLPQTSIFVFIFLKNVVAVLVGFALSPFFCLVPVAALVINGGLLGLVSAMVVQEKSLGYLLAGTLPHGIFELTALIIGEAAALSFGTAVMLALVKQERRKLLLPNLRQNAKYLAIAVILLLPAAIIETYLTPLLVR